MWPHHLFCQNFSRKQKEVPCRLLKLRSNNTHRDDSKPLAIHYTKLSASYSLNRQHLATGSPARLLGRAGTRRPSEGSVLAPMRKALRMRHCFERCYLKLFKINGYNLRFPGPPPSPHCPMQFPNTAPSPSSSNNEFRILIKMSTTWGQGQPLARSS
jgi:hypothetical protein